MFNKHKETLTANQLEGDAETTDGNRKHVQSKMNDYKKRIKLSWNKSKV